MTPLQHSDHILRARPGDEVLVAEPVQPIDMGKGGVLACAPGDRLRVKFSNGDLLWCLAQGGETVTFTRPQMAALDRRGK